MKSFIKKILIFLVKILIGLIPLFLIFLGISLINSQAQSLMIMIYNIGFLPSSVSSTPNYIFIVSGIIIYVLALTSMYYLYKKGLGLFAWVDSIVAFSLLLLVILFFVYNPLTDVLIVQIAFKRGICTTLTAITKDNHYRDRSTIYEASNQEAEKNQDQICTLASKVFNFKYP